MPEPIRTQTPPPTYSQASRSVNLIYLDSIVDPSTGARNKTRPTPQQSQQNTPQPNQPNSIFTRGTQILTPLLTRVPDLSLLESQEELVQDPTVQKALDYLFRALDKNKTLDKTKSIMDGNPNAQSNPTPRKVFGNTGAQGNPTPRHVM